MATVPDREFNFAEGLNINLPFNDEGMPETQEVIQNILIRSFEDKLTRTVSTLLTSTL